jgi:hypothetical protein
MLIPQVERAPGQTGVTSVARCSEATLEKELRATKRIEQLRNSVSPKCRAKSPQDSHRFDHQLFST